MSNLSQAKKYFKQPSKYVTQIIEYQLEQVEGKFEQFVETNPGNALAIYQEYAEWIEAEEGDDYGYTYLERISESN
jgi:hypothetical protein